MILKEETSKKNLNLKFAKNAMPEEQVTDNHAENAERKFTILHLEFRQLDLLDRISISLFAVSIFIDLVFISKPLIKFASSSIIAFAIAFFILTTPFGLRFKNVTFSIIRLVFWKNYHKEFIPFLVAQNTLYTYHSKIEGRGGGKEDRKYMKIMMLIGFIIVMVCVFGMVGKKI